MEINVRTKYSADHTQPFELVTLRPTEPLIIQNDLFLKKANIVQKLRMCEAILTSYLMGIFLVNLVLSCIQ